MTSPGISPDVFFACDLRVGTVLSCEPNARARNPAHVMSIDFGPGIGRRLSSAQVAELYKPEDLVGRQVVAVVNFPPKNVAGVESQCLVLGMHTDGGVVLLRPDTEVPNGARVS